MLGDTSEKRKKALLDAVRVEGNDIPTPLFNSIPSSFSTTSSQTLHRYRRIS